MQRDALLIDEMIDAAIKSSRSSHGPTWASSPTIESGVTRLLWNFTVLGEAASQVSDAVVQRISEVPWRQPILLRNRIVHGYWSIDLGILLATATNQLPDFVTRLRVARAGLDDESPAD